MSAAKKQSDAARPVQGTFKEGKLDGSGELTRKNAGM
jgi:hypothetical protein